MHDPCVPTKSYDPGQQEWRPFLAELGKKRLGGPHVLRESPRFLWSGKRSLDRVARHNGKRIGSLPIRDCANGHSCAGPSPTDPGRKVSRRHQHYRCGETTAKYLGFFQEVEKQTEGVSIGRDGLRT